MSPPISRRKSRCDQLSELSCGLCVNFVNGPIFLPGSALPVVPLIFSTLWRKSPTFESTVRSSALASAYQSMHSLAAAFKSRPYHLCVLLAISSKIDLKDHAHLLPESFFLLLLFRQNVDEWVRSHVRDALYDARLGRLPSARSHNHPQLESSSTLHPGGRAARWTLAKCR